MRPLAEARPEGADRDLTTAFAAHHAFVRERLRGLGVPPTDLDDAAQDVFMVLVRRIADYDPQRPIRHWLAGMARRVARRYRERSRREVIPLQPGAARADVDLDDAVRRSEAQVVLESFLSQLDADRWAVFVLAEIEGLRGTEIAAELGVNLNTVYARLRSARTELERALHRHHARERRGLLALLPFGLGRGMEPIRLVPIVAIVLATGLGATLLVSRQGCAHDEDAPTSGERTPPVSAAAVASDPAPEHATPRVGGGVSSTAARPTDPALPAAKAYAPRMPDTDGWYDAGSAFLTSGPRTLSIEGRYRFEEDLLVAERTYIGDDDATFEVSTSGTDALDGFELVDGPADTTLTIAAGETRVVTQTFRAVREGCVGVHADQRAGAQPPAATSGRHHQFVLEHGKLRHPKDGRECMPIAHPTEEVLSGKTIVVDLYNDCDVAVEFTVFATPEGKQPPPTLPKERIEPGEHRRMRIDQAQWILREGSAAKLDGDAGEVHFYGEGCGGLRTQDLDAPKPAVP
jgi:RNA polymerase sigma-70 factor (ECF subfamily)